MNVINTCNVRDASPFDAIKQTRPDGTEFWSARRLMPLLGYTNWRQFSEAVSRAKIAVEAQGSDVTSLFEVNLEKTEGRPREDVHLTRFAAYQVAMCGDPRKPEVAAALAYFAVRTREAETRPVVTALPSVRELAQMVIDAEDRADHEAAARAKSEKKLAVERKHRAAIEGGDGIDPTTFGKKYFSDVRKTDFDKHLYQHDYLLNQLGTRVRPDGTTADGYDHRKPTAKGRRFFYAHDTGNHGGRRRFAPRVRPQMEIELRDALIAEGLPANEHSTGLVLITNDEMKELEA